MGVNLLNPSPKSTAWIIKCSIILTVDMGPSERRLYIFIWIYYDEAVRMNFYGYISPEQMKERQCWIMRCIVSILP